MVADAGNKNGVPRSGLRSLILLVVWEIWKERNAWTFHRKEQSAMNFPLKIKEEARAWGMAGAKRLASFLSGAWERLLYFCIIYFFFDLFSLRWERLLVNSFTNRNGAQSCRRSFKKKKTKLHTQVYNAHERSFPVNSIYLCLLWMNKSCHIWTNFLTNFVCQAPYVSKLHTYI